MAVAASSSSSSIFLAPNRPSSSSSVASPDSIRFKSHRISAAATATERPSYLFCFNKPSSSLYEVLGISTGATNQEIKTAYRRLARVCHPDVVALDRKDTSSDHFIMVHAAYSTLSDPQKRADYDHKLTPSSCCSNTNNAQHKKRTPFTSRAYATGTAATAAPGYTRRRTSNWETDQCW